MAASGLSITPPPHAHPTQGAKPNQPQGLTHNDRTSDS